MLPILVLSHTSVMHLTCTIFDHVIDLVFLVFVLNCYKRDTPTTQSLHLVMRLGSSYPRSMATVSTVGQIKEFGPNEECIAAYLERFDLYLSVNKIDASVNVSSSRGTVAPLASS